VPVCLGQTVLVWRKERLQCAEVKGVRAGNGADLVLAEVAAMRSHFAETCAISVSSFLRHNEWPALVCESGASHVHAL
jgi:hypothetical protein